MRDEREVSLAILRKDGAMPRKHPINLRKLVFSPESNPFAAPTTVEVRAKTKRRYVRTATSQELVDPQTGEVRAVSMIHTVEEKDDAEFVKVFAEGVKAAFDLNRTAARVFQSVLEAYQKEKMTGGFADSVTLAWFDGGLDGQSIGMSEDTFQRGLKDLLDKNFLSPKRPNEFWINSAMFFKGDRVAFVKEYRRRASSPQLEGKTAKPTARTKAATATDEPTLFD